MLAVLLFVIGSLGIGFAAVVYRADPRRLDNRLFALIAGIDAATAFARALFVSQGYALSDTIVLQVVTALSAAIAAATLEFAFSFPFSRRVPRWARCVNLTAAGLAITWSLVSPVTAHWICEAYFLPAFAANLFLLRGNYRRVKGRANASALKLVIVALALRWTAAQTAFDIARVLDLDTFRGALTLEATAAVLASQVLIGYAVVTGHLFRVRSFLAQVLVMGSFTLAVGAATGALIEAALTWAVGPLCLRLLLFAAALVPLALAHAARHFQARLENVFLGPLDPRRAAREHCLEAYTHKAERADVPSLLALAKQALDEMTLDDTARFLAVPGRSIEGADGVLDDAELEALASSERGYVQLPDGELLAPVRIGGELTGALCARGGEIDHDSVVTAVTLAKHMALRLENVTLVAELEESRRLAALGSFAAAIAHDIRTPLTSVQMNVQILRGKARLPPDDMEHFDIALDELRRLNVHIAQLLDYAKPVRLDSVALEPRELAEEAARTIAPVLADRGIRVVVDDEAAPPVLGDGPRIRQVLLNLVENAARASAPGAAVTVRTAAAPDGRVVIEVRDQGKGMEPADLARIFEPFFTTRPDGTGLGLAIVHKLVRAHQGEVSVRSTPGLGTTVTVLLPAAARHGT